LTDGDKLSFLSDLTAELTVNWPPPVSALTETRVFR
jgi:hypothetical protein